MWLYVTVLYFHHYKGIAPFKKQIVTMETPDQKALERPNTIFGYGCFRGRQQAIIG